MRRFFPTTARFSWQDAMMALLFALLLPSAGLAAESRLQQSPRATVSLVGDHAAVAPGQKLRIGLRQRLAPHWHTYWKNPGDAGYAGGIDSIGTPRQEDIGKADPFFKTALASVVKGESVAQATTRPYGCSVKYKS